MENQAQGACLRPYIYIYIYIYIYPFLVSKQPWGVADAQS